MTRRCFTLHFLSSGLQFVEFPGIDCMSFYVILLYLLLEFSLHSVISPKKANFYTQIIASGKIIIEKLMYVIIM